MPDGFYIKRTLEQLLQDWNPRLYIKELDNPDVDSIRMGDRHICCVPKGGKIRSWYDMMADAIQAEGDVTSDGIGHRTMRGLVETLMGAGAIDINSAFGASVNAQKDFLK